MLCQGLSLPGYLNVPGPPECAGVPEWQGLKNGGRSQRKSCLPFAVFAA